jgi:hemerythrin-like metal-binding protein
MSIETTTAITIVTRAGEAAAGISATGNGTRTTAFRYSTIAHRLLSTMERMFEKNRSAGTFGRQTGPHGLAHFALGNLVEWGDHLSVGNQIIDAQHEVIFGLALKVHELWRALTEVSELRPVVKRLYNALEAHFSYEEALFAETGYPKLDACRTEHRMTLSQLNAIRQRFAGQAQPAHLNPSWTGLDFVLGVTVGHILRDIDYYHHMKS